MGYNNKMYFLGFWFLFLIQREGEYVYKDISVDLVQENVIIQRYFICKWIEQRKIIKEERKQFFIFLYFYLRRFRIWEWIQDYFECYKIE